MGLLMQTTDMGLEQRVKSKQRRPLSSYTEIVQIKNNTDSHYQTNSDTIKQYHKVYKVKLFLGDFRLDFMSCVFHSGKMLATIVHRCQVQTRFRNRKCKGKSVNGRNPKMCADCGPQALYITKQQKTVKRYKSKLQQLPYILNK